MARRRIHQPGAEGRDGEAQLLHTPLDQSRIVGAALKLLQEEGLEQISMRKIADSLGVKAAALYYHVKDREQLLHLLAEQICSEMRVPASGEPWQNRLREWAHSFRRALRLYRDAGLIMNATIAAGPQRLAQIEFLFRLLAEAGFHDAHIPWLSSMVKSYIVGFADEESRLAERNARSDGKPEEEPGRAYAEQFRLSAERYPHMARLIPYTIAADWDEEFAFGLNVLVDGFEARLAQSR